MIIVAQLSQRAIKRSQAGGRSQKIVTVKVVQIKITVDPEV